MCMHTPKYEPPKAVAVAPAADSAEVEAAKEKEKQLSKRRKGRGSTVLTGSTGLLTPADQTTTQTTLGGTQ